MLKAFKKLWNDKRGNVLIIGGAALPMLVGSAGLATDTIQWALWKRQLQRAADSAAIAGVYDRVQSGNTEGTSEVVNHDLDLNQHTGIGLLSGYPQVVFPADAGDLTDQVQVTLAVRKPLAFSSMFMSEAPMIRVSATAASTPGTDDYCVVSLEDTTKTGIDASGSSEVIMDCGMITNSLAANAAAAGGSGTVTATVIAAAGGIQQSNNWNVGKYDPYVPAEDDPYADLAPDDLNLVYNATSLPSALMYAALNEQDLLCRVFGRCLAGDMLDREVGDLMTAKGPVGPSKLFTYVRYNAELSKEDLAKLELPGIEPEHVQQLDSTDYIKELQQVGQAVAKQVKLEHFSQFV